MLGPLLFLIHINDLSDNLTSTVKFFAGRFSFLKSYNEFLTQEQNENLKKIADLAYIWKMQLNPDINKQVLEVFSRKLKKEENPRLFLIIQQ